VEWNTNRTGACSLGMDWLIQKHIGISRRWI
jgi:hypothetical protein